MTRALLWILILTFGLTIASCGGTSQSVVTESGGAPAGDTRTLSGTVNVSSLVVKQGEVLRVTGTTVVNASNRILIDGTVEVADGVSLSLLAANDLIIGPTGSIVPAPVSAQQVRAQALGDVAAQSAPPNTEILLGAFQVTVAGRVTSQNGTAQRRDGGSIVIDATPGLFGGTPKIRVTRGFLSGGHGFPGQATAQPGGLGGSIRIGLALLDGAVPRPNVVLENCLLNAGNGGDGFHDRTGRFGENGLKQIVLTASNGGHGGDINLSEGSTFEDCDVNGGSGGNGGDCGLGSTRGANGSEFGTDREREGESLKASTGRGGDGGTIKRGNTELGGTFATPRGLDIPSFSFLGGDAGDAKVLGAGNGGPNGRGGTTQIVIGEHGFDGAGQPRRFDQRSPKVVRIRDAGNGGDSTAANQDGGFAGSLFIEGAGGFVSINVDVLRSCNGGSGFDGCPGPGSDGGNGAIDVVLGENVNSFDFRSSFEGGRGGNGNPPGAGGLGTGDALDEIIAEDGANGSPCPPDGTRTIESIEVDPSSVTLTPSGTAQLEVTANFDDDTSGEVTAIADFESSAPGVATVNAEGEVTAVSPGQANITVTVMQNGVTHTTTATVQVNPAPPSTASLIVADDAPGNAVYTFSVLAMGDGVLPLSTLPTPTGASHFAHDSTNDRLYLTSANGPSVLLISPDSGPTSIVSTLSVPGGSSLAGVAYDAPDDILYLSLGGGHIGVYASASGLANLSTPTRDILLPSGANVFDLALDPAGDILYVANNGDFRVDIVRDCDTRDDVTAAPADASIPIDLGDGQILGVHLPASNTNHLFVSTTAAVLGFSDPNGTATEVQNVTGLGASDCFVSGADLYVAAFVPLNSVRRYANAFTVTGAAVPTAIQSGNLQNTFDVFVSP